MRVRGGKVSTTDGPFAETKEQLGGYFLIDVGDLNNALRIASKIPAARLGSIEVRPIKEGRLCVNNDNSLSTAMQVHTGDANHEIHAAGSP